MSQPRSITEPIKKVSASQLKVPKPKSVATNPNYHEVASKSVESSSQSANPFARYSLMGTSDALEKDTIAQVPVLGELALLGQSTVIYAAPNTGKTLITNHLIIESIRANRIDPAKLYYLNMDDTSQGLLEKLRIGEEFGFHVLAEGHKGFTATDFRDTLIELMASNQCNGVVLVLDTLKKFVDLMDKGKSTSFTKVIRQFVLKGGTVISLAHTNKNKGQNGKAVYGGTSDVIDDSDCVYMLQTVDEQTDSNKKVVEFENIKKRGNVALTAAYSYPLDQDILYTDLVLSVALVDLKDLMPIKQQFQEKADAEIISVIKSLVTSGVNTKMNLVHAVSDKTHISIRNASSIIEKYAGDDHSQHHWQFTRQARGALVYQLLDSQPHLPESPA